MTNPITARRVLRDVLDDQLGDAVHSITIGLPPDSDWGLPRVIWLSGIDVDADWASISEGTPARGWRFTVSGYAGAFTQGGPEEVAAEIEDIIDQLDTAIAASGGDPRWRPIGINSPPILVGLESYDDGPAPFTGDVGWGERVRFRVAFIGRRPRHD